MGISIREQIGVPSQWLVFFFLLLFPEFVLGCRAQERKCCSVQSLARLPWLILTYQSEPFFVVVSSPSDLVVYRCGRRYKWCATAS